MGFNPMRNTLTLSCALSLFLIGCGGKSEVTVTGEVTIDGNPLPAGRITFYPVEEGVRGASANIENGKYTIKKLSEGEMRVAVATGYIKESAQRLMQTRTQVDPMLSRVKPGQMSPEMRKEYEQHQKSPEQRMKEAKELMAKFREIPGKYANPNRSNLTTTVSSDPHTYNVQLTSK